jgi:hypothetical protein
MAKVKEPKSQFVLPLTPLKKETILNPPINHPLPLLITVKKGFVLGRNI